MLNFQITFLAENFKFIENMFEIKMVKNLKDNGFVL